MIRLVGFMVILIVGLNTTYAQSTVLSKMIAFREQETLRNTQPIASTSVATNSNPFFNHHVVVFFFASTCPYCHAQVPVLSRWARRAGARIEARSFDDKPLPGFETARPVTRDLVDVAFAGRAISYPALFIMNAANGQLFLVSFGALNEDELSARMQALIPTIQQYEQRSQV
jgi:type-F conjugative transfer system pilin assembly thiol-disulfide isomerase TrbB